jgi:hypothetical protein
MILKVLKVKGSRGNLPITIILILIIYTSIIIMSEHALISQRYRGITDTFIFKIIKSDSLIFTLKMGILMALVFLYCIIH